MPDRPAPKPEGTTLERRLSLLLESLPDAIFEVDADGCIVPIQLQGVPSGCILVDLLGGLTEHKLDSEGRIDVDLDGYGYRWLRLRRPEDEPII